MCVGWEEGCSTLVHDRCAKLQNGKLVLFVPRRNDISATPVYKVYPQFELAKPFSTHILSYSNIQKAVRGRRPMMVGTVPSWMLNAGESLSLCMCKWHLVYAVAICFFSSWRVQSEWTKAKRFDWVLALINSKQFAKLARLQTKRDLWRVCTVLRRPNAAYKLVVRSVVANSTHTHIH